MSIQRSTACLPMSSSTLSSFRVPSNPISNSSFWQLKTGWWKLCKCTLFVMLFFLHTSTSCLFNTPKQCCCAGLGSKGRQLQGVYARRPYRMIFSVTWIQLQKLWSCLIDYNSNCAHLSLISTGLYIVVTTFFNYTILFWIEIFVTLLTD